MHAVGVSILNYQAATETVRCVQSLLKAQAAAGGKYSLQVHVADNASDQSDYRAMNNALNSLPGVHVHRHERNLGFAGGHNRNIERLLRRDEPDFIWLLNNDCLVAEQAPSALLDCAVKRPEVAIWGATLLEGTGEKIQCAGGCFYTPWLSSFRQHGSGKPLSALGTLASPRFDYIAGASLFMSSATLRTGLEAPRGFRGLPESQWLNEEFFLYFEELDLAHRLRQGLHMGWCRSALIRHLGGSGTGSGEGRRSSEGEYHSTLSALKFTQLYYPRRLWIMMPARLLAKALQLTLLGQPGLIKPVGAAYRDFMKWLGDRDA